MVLFSHHISKLAMVFGLITMLSLPGASMTIYSISHADGQPQAISLTTSH